MMRNVKRLGVFVILSLCSLIGVHTAYSDDPLVIVPTGDSITRGYSPTRLLTSCTNQGLNVQVTQIATSGLFSSQYVGAAPDPNGDIRDYTGEVIAADPDVICFMLGTNDAIWGTTTTSFNGYKTRIESIFSRFQAAVNSSGEHPRVIVSTLIPVVYTSYADGKADERITNWYNPWLISITGEYGFTLLDLNTRIRQLPDWELLYNDGTHLWAQDAAGYNWMANEFATVIATPEPCSLGVFLLGSIVILKTRRKKYPKSVA